MGIQPKRLPELVPVVPGDSYCAVDGRFEIARNDLRAPRGAWDVYEIRSGGVRVFVNYALSLQDARAIVYLVVVGAPDVWQLRRRVGGA